MDADIFLIGLNHTTADVEVRERFVLTHEGLAQHGFLSPDNCSGELALLSTCNRVELIGAGNAEAAVSHLLGCWAGSRGCTISDIEPYLYVYKGSEAVRHLFSVASSLDSLVLGEPQILGQLKEAYRKAIEQKSARVILSRLMHKAFFVAKRVRTETAVASSAVSISYAAVELAKRIFGKMSDYKAMLIGAGEMAELAAAHLLNSGIKKIYVANRTFEHGERLARRFQGEAVPFERLTDYLSEVDIVISSTGATEPVLAAKDVKEVLKRRKQRPMFFIDIAVPRDIDPDVNSLDNVYLYDIDDLKEVVDENLNQRKEEAEKAKAIVDAEVEAFGRWLKALDLQPTIVDLFRRSEDITRTELERTMKRLPDLPEDTRTELETALTAMLNAVVKKMNHEPITFLKRRFEDEMGPRYIDLARRMFNLDGDESPEDDRSNRPHPERRKPRLCGE